MRDDTHGEVIVAKDFVAFADGVPDKCQHDDAGPWLCFNDDGQYWTVAEMPMDAKGRYDFVVENRIIGGCCSCSKCGKPYTPDFWIL